MRHAAPQWPGRSIRLVGVRAQQDALAHPGDLDVIELGKQVFEHGVGGNGYGSREALAEPVEIAPGEQSNGYDGIVRQLSVLVSNAWKALLTLLFNNR